MVSVHPSTSAPGQISDRAATTACLLNALLNAMVTSTNSDDAALMRDLHSLLDAELATIVQLADDARHRSRS